MPMECPLRKPGYVCAPLWMQAYSSATQSGKEALDRLRFSAWKISRQMLLNCGFVPTKAGEKLAEYELTLDD